MQMSYYKLYSNQKRQRAELEESKWFSVLFFSFFPKKAPSIQRTKDVLNKFGIIFQLVMFARYSF